MTRLKFNEFAALPAGTIFYYFTESECFYAELFRKEETIFDAGVATDFFETRLHPGVEEARDNLRCTYGMGRWALYEYDTAEFIVLDAEDIKELIQNLLPKL